MTPPPKTPYNLRPATEADAAFLRLLYDDTRRNEEPLRNWPKAHREKFLSMQYEAQKESYAKTYPNASHLVVLLNGKPVGRLLLNRTDTDLRVVDICLLEASRSKGVGSQLLRSLVEEAEATKRSLSLHVLVGNPALGLYRRFGFETRPSAFPGRLFLVREPSGRQAQTPP